MILFICLSSFWHSPCKRDEQKDSILFSERFPPLVRDPEAGTPLLPPSASPHADGAFGSHFFLNPGSGNSAQTKKGQRR